MCICMWHSQQPDGQTEQAYQRWSVRADRLPAPLPAPRLIQGVTVLQRILWSQRPPVSNIIPHSVTLVIASSHTQFCVPHVFPIPPMKYVEFGMRLQWESRAIWCVSYMRSEVLAPSITDLPPTITSVAV